MKCSGVSNNKGDLLLRMNHPEMTICQVIKVIYKITKKVHIEEAKAITKLSRADLPLKFLFGPLGSP